MICREIIHIIESEFPTACALDWDNVGLLAGRDDKEVHRIYVALDATDDVIADAIRTGADLLVTHHPLIFGSIQKVTNQNFIGKRLVDLIQNDISYYAMHTNYDVKRMAEIALHAMQLSGGEVLECTTTDSNGNPEGIGRVVQLEEPMTLDACSRWVKKSFRLEAVSVFGESDHLIKTLAICPGSGKGELKEAIRHHADVLITGDIGHHEGIDAVAQGVAVIDAGHYGLEHVFVQDMGCFFREKLEDVQVEEAGICHPFHLI